MLYSNNKLTWDELQASPRIYLVFDLWHILLFFAFLLHSEAITISVRRALVNIISFPVLMIYDFISALRTLFMSPEWQVLVNFYDHVSSTVTVAFRGAVSATGAAYLHRDVIYWTIWPYLFVGLVTDMKLEEIYDVLSYPVLTMSISFSTFREICLQCYDFASGYLLRLYRTAFSSTCALLFPQHDPEDGALDDPQEVAQEDTHDVPGYVHQAENMAPESVPEEEPLPPSPLVDITIDTPMGHTVELPALEPSTTISGNPQLASSRLERLSLDLQEHIPVLFADEYARQTGPGQALDFKDNESGLAWDKFVSELANTVAMAVAKHIDKLIAEIEDERDVDVAWSQHSAIQD